jgi:gliding motility-associated-like protein
LKKNLIFTELFLISILFFFSEKINSQNVTFSKSSSTNENNSKHEIEGKAYQLVKTLDLNSLKNRLITEVNATEKDFDRFFSFYEFNLKFYILDLKEKVQDPKFGQKEFEEFVNQKFRESVFEFKRFLREDNEFISRVSENEYNDMFNIVHKITHNGHTPNQPAAAGEPCQNMDFSGGTSQWQGNYCRGWDWWTEQNEDQCWNGFGNGQYAQMTGGNDGNFSAIPRIPPGSSSALRLGNTSPNNDRATIWQTFRVSQNNYIFVYKWAAVLDNNGNHPASTSPYFKVRMYTNYGTSNQQEITCATVNANSQTANQWGFSSSSGYRYKNWTTMFVPLNQYIGQDVTIWFETSDCMVDAGTHEGYAYIWASCISPNFNMSQPAICNGSSITISAPPGASNYSWSSSPAGAIQGSTSGQTITATQGNATYFVTMTTNTQPPYTPCSVTLDTTIAIQANVTPVFTQIPPICMGSSLSNLPSTSNNGIVGNWSPAINNSQTTNYTFIPNSNQCANNTQMTIEVNPLVSPVFDPVSAICAGESINLPNTSTNNLSGSWSPQINNTATTTYLFTPDAGQCASNTSLSVVVNQLPTAQISGNNTICFGESTTLIASNANSYYWTYQNGNFSGQSITVSPTSSTNYSLNITDQNGCTGSTSYNVTVNPIPQLEPINNQTLCAGQTTSDINFNSSVPNSLINWTNSDISIGLSNSGSGNILNFNASNTGNIPLISTITATPIANGCIGAPQNFSITVNPIPYLNDSQNQLLCSGNLTDEIIFYPSVASATVNWTNSQTSIGLATSGSGNIGSFLALNSGNSPLVSIISATPSVFGCIGSAKMFSISVNPIPQLNAVPSQTVCAGQQINQINYTSSVSGTMVEWSNTQVEIGLAQNGNGNINSFNTVNNGNTTLISNISATPNANGCIGNSVNFSISVNPIPQLSAITNQATCSGQQLSEINFISSVNNTIVNWTNNQTGIGLNANGTGNISSFTGFNNGSTSLTANIIATPIANGCPGNPQNFLITVHPNPTGINASSTFENCGLNNATLIINGAIGGTAPYQYTFNNGSPSSTTLNFNNLSAGTYTLNVTDANGCSFTKTVSIVNLPGPSADFTASQQNGSDSLNVVFTNESSLGPNITYYWNFGNGNLDTTTNLNFSPNQTFYGTNTYTVTLVASNGIDGCNDTTSLLIYIDITPFIEVPNVFTPNNDGVNEYFTVNYKGYKDLNMIIFNRWGNKMFETTNLNVGWDGAGASEGTYYYIVTGKSINNEPFESKGYLTLLR